MFSNSANTISKPIFFNVESYTPTNSTGSEFTKLELSPSQKSSMSFLASQLPAFTTSQVLSNAYVIKFPEGFPSLVDTLMHYKDGGLGTAIMGNKGIAGHASLHELNQVASLAKAFSVMSIATGQYFLTEINSQLSIVNQKIDNIMDFLYGDKKAELISETIFVQDAYRNFNAIMSCECQRIATISNLQNARKVAIKDIEFYLNDLYDTTRRKADGYHGFIGISNKAIRTKSSLELSIQLYVMASLMEIHYAQNMNPDYVKACKESVSQYIIKCERRMLSDFSQLLARNRAFDKKNLLGKKEDTSEIGKKFENIVSQLSDGGNSDIYENTCIAFDSLLCGNEYRIDSDGSTYIRLAS